MTKTVDIKLSQSLQDKINNAAAKDDLTKKANQADLLKYGSDLVKLLKAGSNVTLEINKTTGELTISATGGGSGGSIESINGMKDAAQAIVGDETYIKESTDSRGKTTLTFQLDKLKSDVLKDYVLSSVLKDYAKTSDVNTALGKKADSMSLPKSGNETMASIIAGNNISFASDGKGNITISSTGGGGTSTANTIDYPGACIRGTGGSAALISFKSNGNTVALPAFDFQPGATFSLPFMVAGITADSKLQNRIDFQLFAGEAATEDNTISFAISICRCTSSGLAEFGNFSVKNKVIKSGKLATITVVIDKYHTIEASDQYLLSVSSVVQSAGGTNKLGLSYVAITPFVS